MAVMSDIWIRQMAQEQGMIEPFVETQKREGVISYGLSSYGYDARVADAFKVFTNVDSAIVDPKQFNPNSFVDRTGPVCVIPPNSFVARSPSKSATPPPCPPRSMPSRASASSSSCAATSPARPATGTRQENIWVNAAWHFPGSVKVVY